MKYSIINLKEVANSFDIRIDADYFHPIYLNTENRINNKNFKLLSQISEIKGGKRLPIDATFSKDGVPYIRAEDVKNDFIDYTNAPKISYDLHKKLSHYTCNNNDILLTIVGNSVGDIGIIKFNLDKCNMTENCIKIVNLKDIFPEYLYVVLLSKYGQFQINREKVGTAQPKLAITRIRNFKIPILKSSFQLIIKNIINKAYNLSKKSKDSYNKSEDLLLDELNLSNWKPEYKLYSIKKYSEVAQENRFDAEYFQSKYDEIINKIKTYKNGFYKFSDTVNINDKNIEPKNDIKYKYIELANISKNGEITGSTNDFGKNLPTRARRIVKTNDLIVSSIEGSLDSIALITNEYNNAFCSNGFYVLNSTVYNSETLLCLLKIILGQMQLKRGCSGTILTAIAKNEIEKILLPKISTQIQTQIKINIQEMYANKYKSKQLLNIAKRGVEIAIEKNEEIATKWINEQLSNIGVKI